MSTTDLLDIVIVPVVLTVLALWWPAIQNGHRSRTFKKLIFRELEEIGPYPKQAGSDHWGTHLAKKFTHREILAHVSENRDFILSLDPDLVYCLTQLWEAYEHKDEKQWLYYLGMLADLDGTGKLKQVRADWENLVTQYHGMRKT